MIVVMTNIMFIKVMKIMVMTLMTTAVAEGSASVVRGSLPGHVRGDRRARGEGRGRGSESHSVPS